MEAVRTCKGGTREQGFVPDLDHEIQTGTVYCSNPDPFYEQIRAFYNHVGGFGHLLSMGQTGFLEHDETVKSKKRSIVQLFGRRSH